MTRILFIDDDNQAQSVLKMTLPSQFNVISSLEGKRGLELVRKEDPDLVLLDIDLPDMDGIEVLRQITAIPDAPPVIMLSGTNKVQIIVEAIKCGAVNYVVKPFELQQLIALLLQNLQKRVRKNESSITHSAFAELIGESPAIIRLKRLALRFAQSEAPVLITGETGTGKELIARIIHSLSKRKHGPFIAKNCGAIPPTLLESELFGSEKGAFTDAVSRAGSFEKANCGSLFFDEIGDLSPPSQVKLLRALEEGVVNRLGSTSERQTNVRIISATNVCLEQSVKTGGFRADLYYRINTLPIHLPSLKERTEDIPLIAAHLLQSGPAAQTLSQAAISKLQKHNWPGNVRELKNVLERAAIFADSDKISARDILFGSSL
jgi:DNA-binding NtrC family response regulator